MMIINRSLKDNFENKVHLSHSLKRLKFKCNKCRMHKFFSDPFALINT